MNEAVSFGMLSVDKLMIKRIRAEVRDLLFEALELVEDHQFELKQKIQVAIEKTELDFK